MHIHFEKLYSKGSATHKDSKPTDLIMFGKRINGKKLGMDLEKWFN